MDELLAKVTDLKAHGLIAEAISVNFCQKITKSIKHRVHLAYEYSGPDPTRVVRYKVPISEVTDRVVESFSLKRLPPNPVRLSSTLF